MSDVPGIAKEAVLQQSSSLPEDTPIVTGYDFNAGVDYAAIMASYRNSGFQATNLGKAIDEINKMVSRELLS